MRTTDLKRLANLAQWKERVAECRSSDMKVSESCEAQGICVQTYYRWERCVLFAASGQLQAQNENSTMALTTSYLTSIKNFEGIMNSILSARAPERFTNKFLEDLGYKSSTDRLIVGVLKSLGLLSEAGEPTQRYYDFLDQTQSKKIIAVGIQEAYEDLFNLNKDAQNLSQEEVKNKLKTLTQGQKGDKVIESMARTFRTLCDYADWSKVESTVQSKPKVSTEILI